MDSVNLDPPSNHRPLQTARQQVEALPADCATSQGHAQHLEGRAVWGVRLLPMHPVRPGASGRMEPQDFDSVPTNPL
eukprot:Skav207766  [mRNA]  locus=scaffold2087:94068:99805:+ [translate_table: standard]